MANHFVLRHRELTVTYDVGRNPAHASATTTMATRRVRARRRQHEPDRAREQVSVPLRKSIDAGGETFGFFLPEIDVPLGGCVEFTTAWLYARYSGPDSVPQRPQSWQAIELHGTAQTVEEPL